MEAESPLRRRCAWSNAMPIPVNYRPRRAQFLLVLALIGILIALVTSLRGIAVRADFRHMVVRLAFSPDGETLGASVFIGRVVQLYHPSLMIVLDDQQMAFYVLNVRSSSRPSAVEQRPVCGTLVAFAAEVRASGPSIAFSPDGQSIATANGAFEVALWRLGDKKRVSTFHANDQLLCAVAFSPDGRDLIAGGMNGIHVWHVAEPAHEFLWMKGDAAAFSLALSPDGMHLLSSDRDGNVDLWNLASRKHLARVFASEDIFQFSPVAFSPDSRVFAVPTFILDDGGQVRPRLALRDTATRKEVRTYDANPRFHSAAFAPDGSTLLTDDGFGGLLVDDLKTGQQRAVTGERAVRTLAISPDGKRLATGDDQGNVVLRDFHTMQELARFRLSDRPPPYWLIPIGALFLWAFLWFMVRMREEQKVTATNGTVGV